MCFKHSLFIIYILLSAVNIISIKKGSKLWQHVTKPLLMPVLLLAYLLSTSSPNIFIIFALICGFLGDVFLMFADNFFILGLFSFLIGHLFYITAFIQSIYFSKICSVFYILILPYIFFGACAYKKLLPYVKSVKPKVVLYIIFILTMSFSCLLRAWNVNGCQFWLPYIGSLLFITSDSILALDKFKAEIKNGGVYIMLTYTAAQLFIISGFAG